jgi:hypothetical protein
MLRAPWIFSHKGSIGELDEEDPFFYRAELSVISQPGCHSLSAADRDGFTRP